MSTKEKQDAGALDGVAANPAVVAEIVEALPPRLRKRLDAAVGKLAARPTARDGDTVRIQVDDEAALTLHAPGGVVRTADDVVCACLLAPSCVHRAAAVSMLGIADDDTPADTGAGTGAGQETAAPDGPPAAEHTPEQRAAARALWNAAADVLDAGIPGTGAVRQAALLRAAHTARLAGLHRGAAAAVAATTGLRAARGDDPAYRLADLTETFRELLDTAHLLAAETVPGDIPAAELLGTARQPYAHAGALRLHGLFSEPLRTASGHAGVVTYVLGPDGALRSVSDVMPGTADRIAGAAARAVRMGDTALDHHALSRAGLIVSGATESPTGRLGAGSSVRAVGASGVDWYAEPSAALWAEPPHAQVARVLRARELPQDSRRAGADLVFLDIEILGPVPAPPHAGTRGDRVAARCRRTGVALRLVVADDHPTLAYRDNLRLLAARPGLAVRLIGRLETGTEAEVRALAAAPVPDDPGPAYTLVLAKERQGRVNLGLDRLQQADLPRPDGAGDTPGTPGTPPEHGVTEDHPGVRPLAPPLFAGASEAADTAPTYLVHRHIERALSGGRPAVALAGSLSRDTARLRRDGFGTAADLLEHLVAAAADRDRDVFGRLLPADTDRLARCWLATAAYARAVNAALTAHAWQPPESVGVRAEHPPLAGA
ncbi:hypothetical protein LO772_14270 [Yinghuangia sp. ASG 101]|uniref:hypothetical protein n=1 Tax=Yinghuangia sp. ASG 101 TaxID=2896848 RepID=UPI001E4716CA|nr:hypothetical protein [Yinghuangia sp. ASG 101]UGQ14644.1 hypothetical protein LO772_14270 [Yinghuangia sp. ASG 101]